MKKHKKHPQLTKPVIGEFNRNELSLVGAPCGDIQQLFAKVVRELKEWKVQYIDASHGEWNDGRMVPSDEELITFDQGISLTRYEEMNPFDHKIHAKQIDFTLVNGNHFHCSQQVVFLHPSKIESLQRKVDRLSNVVAVLNPQKLEIPEFLSPLLNQDAPIITDDLNTGLLKVIRSSYDTPTIKGLVLAGGKSQRMGSDKGTIRYSGLPQREKVFNLLEASGIQTHISCRHDQLEELNNFNPLADRLNDMGPFGAIVSAFMTDPDAAWLAVACDLPSVSDVSIKELLEQRDPSKVATAFQSPNNEFPEPLITLWEPKAYTRVLEFMALGYSCPRKVLINSDIKLIQHPKPIELQNINTPEELKAFDPSIDLS